MDWLPSNWPTLIGWLVTVAISAIGWVIEAHARKKGEQETNRQLEALETLSLATARKDDSDPWGQPQSEMRDMFRIINVSQRMVTVTGIDVDGDPYTEIPYDCGPGDCIRYAFFSASWNDPAVHLEWHFKDESDKPRTSIRQTPNIIS